MSRRSRFAQGAGEQPTPPTPNPIEDLLARTNPRPVDPNVPVMNAEPAGPVARPRPGSSELEAAGMPADMSLSQWLAQNEGVDWQGTIDTAMAAQPERQQDPEVMRRVIENAATMAPMQPSPEELEWRSQQDQTTTGDVLRGIGVEGAQSLSRTAQNISHTVTHPEDIAQLVAHPSRYDDVAKLWLQSVRENPMDFAADLATGAVLTAGTGLLGAAVAGPTRRVLQASGHADEALSATHLTPNAPDVPRVNTPDVAPQVGLPEAPRTMPRTAPDAEAPVVSPTRTPGAPARPPSRFPDAQKLGPVGRLDTRLAAGVERRLARRSNFQPTNLVRRALGRETRDLSYSRAARAQTRVADWVGGDSPNLLRQYAKARITRSEGAPDFPEGTNPLFQAYEMSRWRNQQLMRLPNRARAISGAPDLLQKAELYSGIAADPVGYFMGKLGEEEQARPKKEEEEVIPGRPKPKLPSMPYQPGRGFGRITATVEEEDTEEEEGGAAAAARAAVGAGQQFGQNRDMLRR